MGGTRGPGHACQPVASVGTSSADRLESHRKEKTMNTPTTVTTPGFTATILETGGFHHELVVNPLPGLPPTVNLRVMTRYDHSRDPGHRREVLNLSLQRREIEALIGHLQNARDLI